jgi:thioesterase domain-containing protein
MAEQYLAEIRRAQPQGPWHLAGWSFGGLVAFETARRLRAAGEDVALLALIDPTDPADLEPAPDGELALSGLLRELGIPLEGIELTPDESHLPPEARLSVLFTKAKEAGRLRPWDNEAELRRRFEVFRASAGAARAYRLAPYEGPLDLLEPATLLAPKAGNWRPLARSVQVLPGDHFSLLVPPQVDELAAALNKLLA